MGLGYSTPTNPVENVKTAFNLDKEREFLDSLNITEFKQRQNKPQLPIIGGVPQQQSYFNNNDNIDFNLVGGNNDVRFLSKQKRYLRHNVFKILAELDKAQSGGNGSAPVVNDDDYHYSSIGSDDSAIKQIRQIISNEINKINTTQSGGGCGCEGKGEKQKGGKGGKGGNVNSSDSDSSESSESADSESSSEEAYPRRKKKGSKGKKKISFKPEGETSDSIGVSDDGSVEVEESPQNGLSIFPFNSSEVKSSVSEKKNMRMIRRKI
jgi:hypothetical protein